MKICGLQKLTLLDFPSKTACTVFTGGCNFACPFCHNSSLVMEKNFDEAISNEKFFEFLKMRKGILDGVCVTGGEPLIQKDIDEFLYNIKKEGFSVKLDTNGSFPDRLDSLVSQGLVDYVAMDIKSSKENYSKAIGTQYIDIDKVNQSVSILMRKKIDFEFRTTAVKGIHTIDDFKMIGEWIKGDEKYFIQNYADSGDTIEERKSGKVLLSGFSNEELEELLAVVSQFVPLVKIRGL